MDKRILEIAIEASVSAGRATLKYYNRELDVMVKSDNSPLTLADLESNQVINEFLCRTDFPILSEENRLVSWEERKSWNVFWLVDPLDGTKEFINKRSEYTINIALVENGIPVLGVVYAPVPGLLYYGLKEEGSFKVRIKPEDTIPSILKKSVKLEAAKLPDNIRIVASRSHLSDETIEFITQLEKYHPIADSKSFGSSLKLCVVAEGMADIYPRLGPTMEWDTAASHAVALYAGSKVIDTEKAGPLVYNKENLLNPYFVVYNALLDPTVRKIISKG